MNYDLLVKAKQVLQPLWQVAWLKGHCWGPKSEKNPYSATNITFCIGNELVSVSQQGEKVVIHEFQRVAGTKLGNRTRELLQKAGVMSVETKEILSPSANTWYCVSCGKRGEFDPGLLDEVDSRGEGARDVIGRIDKDHREASPGCLKPRIEVLDKNLVKQEELTKLLTLERVK